MLAYSYKGVTFNGKKMTGIVEADSKMEAMSKMPIFKELIYVRRSSGISNLGLWVKSLLAIKIDKLTVANMFYQLASMIETGASQVTAFELLSKYGDKKVSKLSALFLRELQNGDSLSQVLYRHRKELGMDYSAQVKAAEDSATLNVVAKSLCTQLEADVKLHKKVRSTLMIPVLTLILALVMVYFIIKDLVPVLLGMFTDSDIELSKGMILLMQLAELQEKHTPLILVGLLGVGALLFYLIKKPFAYQFDCLLLKIPVVKKLIASQDLIYLYRFLGNSLRARITLDKGLLNTLETLKSRKIRRDMEKVRLRVVNEGIELYTAVADLPYISGIDKQTLAMGVNAGILDEMLLRMADQKATDMSRLIDSLTELIDPAITIFLGLIIAGLAYVIYEPMNALILGL